MRYILTIITGLFLISCSQYSMFSMLGIDDKIDNGIPTINAIRTLPDVTSVGIEWDAPKDLKLIDGYVIYRKSPNEEFEKIAVINNAYATHYYDKKLKPQTSYIYAMASLGKSGSVSPKSKEVNIKTSFIDAVEWITTSKDYAKQVKIIWSPSPNPSIKTYIIQKLMHDKFINIGEVPNRLYVEYFDKDLDDGTSYSYRVIGKSFEGALSLPSKVEVGKTRYLPNMVLNIKATQDLPREIRISWDESKEQDIQEYNIYVAQDLEGSYKLLATSKGNFYVDKLPLDGVTRYYKITALDSYKLESKPSSGAIFGKTLNKPATPSIIKSGILNNEAMLSWERLQDPRVKGYVVYRKHGSFSSFERFAPMNKTSFVDKEIEQNKEYIYYVTSIDENNIESNPSNEVVLKNEIK